MKNGDEKSSSDKNAYIESKCIGGNLLSIIHELVSLVANNYAGQKPLSN